MQHAEGGTPVKPLSPLDAAFFHLEDGKAALHIASLAIFEGPVPTREEIRAAMARKLPLVPRYRMRNRALPLHLGRPVWVDYPHFDLDEHVHAMHVPAPHGDAQLAEVMGELMSRPLNRDRPLWQVWLVDGLSDGRWAMVTKLHHSMADGIAGMDLLSTVLDKSPEPDEVPTDTWRPRPEPSTTTLAVDALRRSVSDSVRVATALVASSRRPRAAARSAAATARGLAGFAAALWPVSSSSLLGPIGARREFCWTEVPLPDVLEVRERLGGTVNDVVLAAVSQGFRELLLKRGESPAQHSVRTLVPVSVRREDEHGDVDNRVSAILAELPVADAEPTHRLHDVTARMRRLKGSQEAQAGEAVTELADLVPDAAVAALLHVAFRLPQRVLTTVVTNVPGPRATLYLAGRRMVAQYPYVPIADRVRVGVAVTSYEGRLLFGFTGDAESTPDLDVLSAGVESGFQDPIAAAAHGRQ